MQDRLKQMKKYSSLKKKKQSEWRKVHNGKWAEYKEPV